VGGVEKRVDYPRSLAEVCFDLAGGEPLEALWLAVRATQLEAERTASTLGHARLRSVARGRYNGFRLAPEALPEALRLLAEGLTREEISERLGWP
jgi:hypothetical protein